MPMRSMHVMNTDDHTAAQASQWQQDKVVGDSVCTPLNAPLYTVRHILHVHAVQHRGLPGLGPRHPSWLPQLCRLHNLQSSPSFNAFIVQATFAHAAGLASTCMNTICRVLATQECTCDCIVCGCCTAVCCLCYCCTHVSVPYCFH